MAQSDLSSFLSGEDPPGTRQNAPRGPSPAGTAAAASAVPAPSAPVQVNNRLSIRPDQPLPELNSANAAAFSAFDLKDGSLNLVGYICRPGLPPRLDVLSQLRSLSHPTLVRHFAFAVVDWPLESAQRPAVVLERPVGRRLIPSMGQKRAPVPDDQIVKQIVPPLAQALAELRARRVFHGAINPSNIFMRESEGRVQLSECVTTPLGLGQATAFETIERAMAQPAGRGPGTTADDLYALGATLLYLIFGQIPGAALDDRALLAAKIEKGSFAALAGDARLPNALAEAIRGLLIDDVASRWCLEDLELWVNGRRLSPRQAPAARKATRPVVFAGQEHLSPRSLAAAMTDRPAEVQALIDRGDLQNWLARSLEDDRVARRVDEALNTAAAGRGGSVGSRRLARLLTALDPLAPIRYRNKAVAPLGLGLALAEAFSRGGSMTELAEILVAQLPLFWINCQPDPNNDQVPLPGTFETVRTYLERPNPGYGIERVLYELNPSLPCASPILGRHCVLHLEALMRALEDVASEQDRPAEPIDRHIAAFIMTRNNRMNERLFQTLAPGTLPTARAMATLEILFELQRQTRIQSLPKLCGWVAATLEPMIQQYHSRTLRDRVRDALAKQAATGSFRDMLAIARNTNLAERDSSAFEAARRDYQTAERVINQRQDEAEDENFGLGTGRQVAAMAGSLLSAVLIVIIILIQSA